MPSRSIRKEDDKICKVAPEISGGYRSNKEPSKTKFVCIAHCSPAFNFSVFFSQMMKFIIASWVMVTPLGFPVVPDV